MCAIVDAQVAEEVFGKRPSPAGRAFRQWLFKGPGHLVTGGKLLKELRRGSEGFRRWEDAMNQSALAGRMTTVNEKRLREKISQLEHADQHKSNDPHVLALAQISGARLLFTNDRQLGKDFGSKSLIDDPRGRVYHTRDIKTLNDNKQFSKTHKRLLSNTRLCRASR